MYSKKNNMNELIIKQKQTHRHRKQTYGYQGEMGGINEEYEYEINSYISSVQSLSRVQLFVTPWTAAHLASYYQLPELAQTRVQ